MTSPRDVLTVLPLLVLPILTYLGSILNPGNNNFLLLLAIMLVALFAFVICLPGNLVSEKFYPLAIATISFCLLFHVLWISPYLIGWDVHFEYFLFELVKTSGHYVEYPHAYNSALSVTILPAMVQSLVSVGDTAVFKTIYPLVFSFVPVTLYASYKCVVDNKRAFLSAFLFMSFVYYYSGITFIAKQMIGEAILAPIILLTLKIPAKGHIRVLTMLILIAGLVVSSYTVSYVYISFMFLSLLLLAALKKRSVITYASVAISALLALGWYMYASAGMALAQIVNYSYEMSQEIYYELFNPQARGLQTLKAFGIGVAPGLVNSVDLLVHYAILGFIVIGVVTLWKKRKFVNGEFLSYTPSALSLLILSVGLPYFAVGISINRIFHMVLIFLSPACVLGGESLFKTTFQALSKLSVTSRHAILPRSKGSMTFVSSIIILFLLFNTGFINEISAVSPISLSLGLNRLKVTNDQEQARFLFSAFDYIPEQNSASARWLSEDTALERTVCGDATSRRGVLLPYLGIPINLENAGVPLYPGSQASCTYVYLGYMNVVKGLGDAGNGDYYDMSELSYLVDARNRIYSNGGSDILV